jgi:rhamnosyl/mannosyltransferase
MEGILQDPLERGRPGRAAGTRVLHVGKYFPPFPGGLESLHADLCAALQHCGVATLSLVHDHARGGATRQEWIDRGGETLRVVRARTHGSLLFAPVSPGFPLDLRRAIRDFRPQVIHAHLPNLSAFWLLVTPAARRLPWVLHWHADVVPSSIATRLRWAYRLYRPFESALLARAKRVIVTSPPYLASSAPLVPWRDKCVVVPPGIDLRRLPPPTEANRQAAEQLWGVGAHRVLTIGRLTYYKGHRILLQAAARLPGARFLLVGTGDLEAGLRSDIQRLGLSASVQLLGQQSDAMLLALLDTCSCLCLPSLERTEAFGLVLLEAMRYAKPAVVTDVKGSGMGWVVRHGETGLVVRAGDPQALSDALAALLSDDYRRCAMGKAARARLDADFRIETQAQAIAEVYAAVCTPGDAPPDGNR